MKTTEIILFIFFLSLAQLLYAKEHPLVVLTNEKQIGINSLNGEEVEITVNEFIFPERINDFYLDTVSHSATLQLRGFTGAERNYLSDDGTIVLFDLKDKKVRWHKQFNYFNESIAQFDDVLLHEKVNKSFRLDIHTGEQLWKAKAKLYHIDRMHKMGIGYGLSAAMSNFNVMKGVDLETGQLSWKRNFKDNFGWHGAFYLNDSTLLVEANGLWVNMRTGKGDVYTANIIKKEILKTVLLNALGITLGVFTGTYVVFTGYDMIGGLSSNMLMDDKMNLYYSSRDKLAALSGENLEILWSQEFPNKLLSNSFLFDSDNLIYIINMGYGFRNNELISYGTPFLAAYNKSDGSQEFFKFLFPDDKKIYIKDIMIKDKILYLLRDKQIVSFSLDDGRMIKERTFNVGGINKLEYFVQNGWWYRGKVTISRICHNHLMTNYM